MALNFQQLLGRGTEADNPLPPQLPPPLFSTSFPPPPVSSRISEDIFARKNSVGADQKLEHQQQQNLFNTQPMLPVSLYAASQSSNALNINTSAAQASSMFPSMLLDKSSSNNYSREQQMPPPQQQQANYSSLYSNVVKSSTGVEQYGMQQLQHNNPKEGEHTPLYLRRGRTADTDANGRSAPHQPVEKMLDVASGERNFRYQHNSNATSSAMMNGSGLRTNTLTNAFDFGSSRSQNIISSSMNHATSAANSGAYSAMNHTPIPLSQANTSPYGRNITSLMGNNSVLQQQQQPADLMSLKLIKNVNMGQTNSGWGNANSKSSGFHMEQFFESYSKSCQDTKSSSSDDKTTYASVLRFSSRPQNNSGSECASKVELPASSASSGSNKSSQHL